MNNRQIELQVIIRNLQNKILIQKEQAKILSERFEQRLRQTEEEAQRRLIQKEKMIQYLTIELDKDRQLIMNEQYLYESKRTRQRDEIYAQCERLRGKNAELQKKLQSMIEKYELEKRDLENEIKKFQEKEYDQSFSRASIEGEIEKLNKFYHQSRIDQPKRKELVEWTEKLSNLIDKSEIQNSKSLEQLFSFIKGNLESFKAELMQSLNNASEFEEQILKNKKEILNNIKQIIQEETKTKNQMAENNEKLYEILKKQRINSQAEKIGELQRELTQTKKKSNQINQQLHSRIKSLQNERKTLLLGFTQLKNLNEARQKTYKQQILALKQAIQSLLTTGEQRQYEFEKQMKVLHGQLTSISERYYENIQVPLSKITNKLDNQIKVARSELQKLADNRVFIRTIHDLEQVMQSYIVENTNSFKFNSQIIEYAKKTDNLISWAQQICQSQNQRQLFLKSNEKNKQEVSKQSVDSLHGKINTIQSNLRQVQWKERENKLLYQLNTAKKMNKKMKDYCAALEEKFNTTDNRNVSPIKKGKSSASSLKANNPPPVKMNENPVKVYQLQAEVQRLSLLNKNYSEQHLYQLNLIKGHIEKLTGKQIKDEKNLLMMQKGIQQISEFNEKLSNNLERQNSHMTSIRQILSTLNKILVKPVQTFDNFVDKLTNCYQTPLVSTNKFNNQTAQTSSVNLFANLQQVYKQMHGKRQEYNSQASRLLTDFIKLLRQTTPNHQKSHIKTQVIQTEKEHPLQKSRIGSKENGVEKKIRDLQNMRIKSREEVIKKMEKIEDSLKNIEAKYSKRHFTNLNRIEETITRKIDEMREKCFERIKQNNLEINELTGTVLKDIKNKLKLCMNQNEGLVKQVELLQKFKKKQ